MRGGNQTKRQIKSRGKLGEDEWMWEDERRSQRKREKET